VSSLDDRSCCRSSRAGRVRRGMLEGRRAAPAEGILSRMGLFGSSPRPRGVQMRRGWCCGGTRGATSEFDGVRRGGTHR
jgi:hypothetical protein